MKMTYASAGVDYDSIDRFKRLCQGAAKRTARNPIRLGFEEIPWSRGQSAYLLERYLHVGGSQRIAFVDEGLGTKELVAAKMLQLTGVSHYRKIAQCVLATIVNDMGTLALPLAVSMHCAVGSSRWFDNEAKCVDLAEGYADACMLARCAWGCGETSVLTGVIRKHAAVLAGAAVGVVPKNAISGKIQHGDAIIILGSSGIHANALTMARKLAARLKKGYLTELPDGRTYGEALLEPTHIYVPFIEDCLRARVPIHYVVNVTGHGWRKLMRHEGAFRYRLTTMPARPPIFDFIMEQEVIEWREMFSNLNMGAGYALCVPACAAESMLHAWRAGGYPFPLYKAGYVEEAEYTSVEIETERGSICFSENELQLR